MFNQNKLKDMWEKYLIQTEGLAKTIGAII
jgi:hypothetical protein